jgi:HlyD family secretion protein
MDGGQFFSRTVFVLSGQGKDAKLESRHIKVGITDGINTEVLDGINEGDNIVTALIPPAGSDQNANPFGGGFPRFR